MMTTIHPQHVCLHNFTRISSHDKVPLCEPWDSLLNKAEELHNEGDLDGAIETAAAVYDKLVRHQVRALELKSRCHLKKRNYTLALQDAVDVVHMAPLMAVGYLLKVDVYLAQYQTNEALDVCKDALQIIQESSSRDGYRAITAKMAEVKSGLVDFVTKLPTEVLSFIFRNLPQDDILTVYMVVSKTWRYRLTHCAPLWEVIRPGYPFMETEHNPAMYFQIGSYVRRCCITSDSYFLTDDAWMYVFFQGMKLGMFGVMRELDITITDEEFLNLGELQAIVLAGLEGVGRTLKMLKISLGFRLFIPRIQRCCPNLCALAYRNDTVTTREVMENFLTSTNMHSLSIELHNRSYDIPKDFLPFISSAYPNLRRLHINGWQDVDCPLFDEHYPFLESLSFYTDADWDFWEKPTTNGSPVGLTSLSIQAGNLPTVMHYLKQHQQTLESFYLMLPYDLSEFQPHEVLHNFDFTRLQKLTFDASKHIQPIEIVDAILEGCICTLEELTISKFYVIQPSTYDLMANIPSLRVLCINRLSDSEGLTDYIKTVSSIQQHLHSLKEVRLEETDITDEVLAALAQLKMLQSVTIRNAIAQEKYTNEGLNWFFGNHALHSNLRNITLWSCEVDQITYSRISKIRSLKTLNVPHHPKKYPREDLFQFTHDRPDVVISFLREDDIDSYW